MDGAKGRPGCWDCELEVDFGFWKWEKKANPGIGLAFFCGGGGD